MTETNEVSDEEIINRLRAIVVDNPRNYFEEEFERIVDEYDGNYSSTHFYLKIALLCNKQSSDFERQSIAITDSVLNSMEEPVKTELTEEENGSKL
ncbi:MAG: hypothetical protein RLY43_565 [Bacteroidota bacterium]|jgi:hypothetical protein